MIRTPSRARRIAKWIGLVVCVVFAVAWVVSFAVMFGYHSDRPGRSTIIGVLSGSLLLVTVISDSLDQEASEGWSVGSAPPIDILWLPGMDSRPPLMGSGGTATMNTSVLPLWIPALLTAIPTFILWRRDRRHPPGHCKKCGYDLTGNMSGACSECGRAT